MRLKDYDYSSGGYYFITICTKDKAQYFGKIEKDEMILSAAGKIALDEWGALPDKYENIELDLYQVMPDHFHGIIILNEIIPLASAPRSYNAFRK
jgi:REP element-mobilizing transposase RayT